MTVDGEEPAWPSAGSVLREVHDRLRGRAGAATDPRVTVGDRLVLVEVDHAEHGRLAGVAHRPGGDAPTAGSTRGTDGGPGDGPDGWPDAVPDIAALAVETPAAVEKPAAAGTPPPARLRRAVGVAALSALSAPDVDWRSGDPMAALPGDVERVATVGLFRPALRKFGGCEVRVVERTGVGGVGPDGDGEPPDGVTAVHPPAECDRAFDGADVVFVTGSTLVYGGLDRYLAATDDDQPVVLVGATASVLPGPALDAGVDVVAGARVTDADAVRERVAAGDCATDLHGEGLEKCSVAAAGPSPGLSLAGGNAAGEDREVQPR